MADLSGQRVVRVMATALASVSGCAAYDRRYSFPGLGGTLDVPLQDAQILNANGYALLGLVGPTSARPSPRDADWLGGGSPPLSAGGVVRMFDTTLSAWIVYDASSATGWRNSATGAAV